MILCGGELVDLGGEYLSGWYIVLMVIEGLVYDC